MGRGDGCVKKPLYKHIFQRLYEDPRGGNGALTKDVATRTGKAILPGDRGEYVDSWAGNNANLYHLQPRLGVWSLTCDTASCEKWVNAQGQRMGCCCASCQNACGDFSDFSTFSMETGLECDACTPKVFGGTAECGPGETDFLTLEAGGIHQNWEEKV